MAELLDVNDASFEAAVVRAPQPALVVAKGRIVGQITGARSRAAFRELVERALAA